MKFGSDGLLLVWKGTICTFATFNCLWEIEPILPPSRTAILMQDTVFVKIIVLMKTTLKYKQKELLNK
jgi:hypothetical protein